MKLSIVTTLFKSTEYIQEFYTRISIEAQKITQDYEIIFVDDGSPDDSLQKAVALFEMDNRVKVIELSRNFGHHKAAMTGLSHAMGDYIFYIDSDLEEEPELLGIFWAELKKTDMDVIYGVQEKRKGGWFKKISGDIFYVIFNKISDIKLSRNLVTARLTTKNYNQALILHKERNFVISGLLFITGFKQKSVLVKKNFKGKTTYVFRKKVSLFIDSVTSFSIFPLKCIFYIGFIFSFLSSLFILWIFFKWFFFNIGIEGWTSLIISIWFIGGIVIMFLGIIGIYISKIFNETKKRPYTIIRRKYEKNIN